MVRAKLNPSSKERVGFEGFAAGTVDAATVVAAGLVAREGIPSQPVSRLNEPAPPGVRKHLGGIPLGHLGRFRAIGAALVLSALGDSPR